MIRLRTLGALDLRAADGQELRTVLAQPKRLALLAYLALATPRGAHQRDKLVALFWPEQDPEHARNALSQSVHFLRRWLSADVIGGRGADELAVNRDLLWCDAVAFEEALEAGRLAEALELYRGDLLQGFHLSDAAVELERWVESERARLMQREVAALESLAKNREEAGDFGGAVIWWQRLAARDPLSSRIALRLMRAFASAGDPGAALRHARVHETLLKRELDVAPDSEVAAFVRELRSTPDGAKKQPQPKPVIGGGVVLSPVAEAEPVQAASPPPFGPASPPARPVPARPVAEPIVDTIVETDRRLEAEHSTELGRPGRTRSRRVAMLTAALITVSVGVAYAVVWRETPDKRRLQELYRRGQNAEVNRSLVGIQTAMQYYRTAIERDSGFALGYAALSHSYHRLAHYDFAPKGASLDSARILAHKAVALDSTLAETRSAMAMSLASSGHFAPAEGEFRSAIRLSPSNPEAHSEYGMLLISLGRGEEALAEAELALKLDPLGPRLALTVKTHATFLITGQRPQRKLPTAERRPILKVEPGEPWARAHQAVELADDGHCADARSDMSSAKALVPDSNRLMLAFAGLMHWSCGDRAQARELLAQMKQRPDAQDHALRVAMLHTRFGEKDSAFAWLDRHQWIISEYGIVRADPWLDSLRSDPRFPQLMSRLGIR